MDIPVEVVNFDQNLTIVSQQRGLSPCAKILLFCVFAILSLVIFVVILFIDDPDYFIYKLRGYDDHEEWESDLLASQENILEEFWNFPDIKFYQLGENNLNKHFENQYYGGSVLEYAIDEKGVQIPNVLKTQIEQLQKHQIMGFYEFNNVLVNKTKFYDKYIDMKILAVYDRSINQSQDEATAFLDTYQTDKFKGKILNR